jgi:plasmanylethanolamine desaturase
MDDLSRYGRAQRFLELSGIALFALLVAVHLPHLRFSLLGLTLAWVAADLLSGLAHWAFDRFGSVRTPLFGPAFIRPFREHHVDPAAMTRHDFVETNGASCLACVPLLLLALFLPAEARTFLVFLSAALLLTNQCHKWAHMDRRPPAVAFLQRIGLILRPAHHSIHHSPPFASHYCTASGWLNPVLNRVLAAKLRA